MMNNLRRKILTTTSLAYTGCFCCGEAAFAQFPTSRTDKPNIDIELNSSNSENTSSQGSAELSNKSKSSLRTGCWLHSKAELGRAYGTGALERNLLPSTGSSYLDKIFESELARLMSFFGVTVGIYTNGDNNAFATPERLLNHARPDGTVVIGRPLIEELFGKFSSNSRGGAAAIVGVIAHEFGHIVYYKSGLQMPRGKFPELHADYMSGWYNGIRSLQEPGNVNLDEISQQMFDIGDDNYRSPDHHGTPIERQRSYIAGVNLALSRREKAALTIAFQEGLQYVKQIPR